jgi:AcrR family transcriptional regulator
MPGPRRSRGAQGSATTADPRGRILTATRQLLDARRFDALSVADILAEASVSRASFYFYFASKQEVLAELVRAAVQEGQEAAEPWLQEQLEPRAALRAGVTDGAHRWRANAGVLTAIVENFGSDDGLRALWLEQMDLFTEAATQRIGADPVARRHLAGQDVRAMAASLTWMGERLYYLAARGIAPFDDEDVLVTTLTNAWVAIVYGDEPATRRSKRRSSNMD